MSDSRGKLFAFDAQPASASEALIAAIRHKVDRIDEVSSEQVAHSPVLMPMMLALVWASASFISPLTTKYRDLHFGVTLGVFLLLYATLMIYPVSSTWNAFNSLS
jgi:ABC-type polysaccharide/polyol phosphate export permease